VDWVRTRVENGIVQPLAERAGSPFSRARPPPRERRVRVLQTTAVHDKSGRPFVPFAIDVRFVGGAWQTDDIVGCAYPRNGDLFVKRGDGYRPASFLLGKNADPVPGVCEAAPVAAKGS
jgi:hypothetical protein